MLLSVVLPTYNEAANVGGVVRELQAALAGLTHEILVVDDNSPDGTARVAEEAGARVIVRTTERGLATAVVRGFQEARGDYVAVVDADGQHPPEVVRRMIDKVRVEDADLVIGSRYVEGGSVGDFGPLRRLVSLGAATIARIALPAVRQSRLTDPMTGLFLVRRSRLSPEVLRPTGYKILLEVLAKARLDRIEEVGYTFQNRRGGESKLGSGVVLQFLAHTLSLGWSHPENRRILRFGGVGLTGVVVNLGLLWSLHGLYGLHATLSAAIAVEASILSNFFLNDRFTFQDRRHHGFWTRFSRFQLVSTATLVVNLAVFSILHGYVGVWYLLAEGIAIVTAFAANYAGNMAWTYGRPTRPRARSGPWIPFVLLVAASGWLYFHDLDGIPEVYFDESYYLAVAKQMDNGVWEDPCWDGAELSDRPLNFEHPPLAKLMMWGASEQLDTYHGVFPGCRDPDGDGKEQFDDWIKGMKEEGSPFAWRAPSALMATLAVLAIGLAAGRLFGGPGPAFLAAGLVAMDGLVLTSGRIAILDIFAAGFGALAIWAATHPTRTGILGTGVFLGLAFASKYTAFFLGPFLLLLVYWVHWRAGRLSRARFDIITAAIPGIPLLVWVLSYAPWWAIWIPEHGLAWSVGHFLDVTKAAIGWGTVGNKSPHDYASTPLQWLTFERPMFYYQETNHGGIVGLNRYVYAFGNPVLWWLAAATALGTLAHALFESLASLRASNPWRWFCTRTAGHQALIMGSLVAVSTFCGFLLLERTLFVFYMTFLSPILALVLAGGLVLLGRQGPVGAVLGAGGFLLALAAFVHFYPLWVAEPVQVGEFHQIFRTIPWMHR